MKKVTRQERAISKIFSTQETIIKQLKKIKSQGRRSAVYHIGHFHVSYKSKTQSPPKNIRWKPVKDVYIERYYPEFTLMIEKFGSKEMAQRKYK